LQNDPGFWEADHALASREAERMRELASTLERLAQQAAAGSEREPCDGAALVREVALQAASEASAARTELRIACEDGAPLFRGARAQIQQALLHLVLHAVRASRPGAVVWLRLASGAGREGSLLVFEVSDEGCGITAEQLERVFDPFSLAHAEGKDGGSLGLLLCHGIVADHGGILEVHTRPGEGSTFRVSLPAVLE
jgi:signal transduction histidine kinase